MCSGNYNNACRNLDIKILNLRMIAGPEKLIHFSAMWLYILPKVKKKHKLSNKYMSMCFLSSYEHLKFDLDRVQINMLK